METNGLTDLTASDLGLDFLPTDADYSILMLQPSMNKRLLLALKGWNQIHAIFPFLVLVIPESVDDSFEVITTRGTSLRQIASFLQTVTPCVGACCFNSWSIHNAFGEPLKRIYKRTCNRPTYQKHNLKTDSEHKKQMNPNLFHSPIHICASNCQYS